MLSVLAGKILSLKSLRKEKETSRTDGSSSNVSKNEKALNFIDEERVAEIQAKEIQCSDNSENSENGEDSEDSDNNKENQSKENVYKDKENIYKGNIPEATSRPLKCATQAKEPSVIGKRPSDEIEKPSEEGDTAQGTRITKRRSLNNSKAKASFTSVVVPDIATSAATDIGSKKENQDTSFYIEFPTWNVHVSACFDGHGKRGLVLARQASRFFQEYFTSHFSPNCTSDGDSMPEVLRKAFELLENEFLDEDKKFRELAMSSGTTATISVIMGNTLYVAHVGDSRAVCFENSNGEIVLATKDHRVDDTIEREQVLSRGGGEVRPRQNRPHGCNRVFIVDKGYPGLMLSRSIGDVFAKQGGCSAVPDIETIKLNQDTKYTLVLCSDGVWDWLSNNDMVELLLPLQSSRSLVETTEDHQTVASTLLQAALQKGIDACNENSLDNATAVVSSIQLMMSSLSC